MGLTWAITDFLMGEHGILRSPAGSGGRTIRRLVANAQSQNGVQIEKLLIQADVQAIEVYGLSKRTIYKITTAENWHPSQFYKFLVKRNVIDSTRSVRLKHPNRIKLPKFLEYGNQKLLNTY